jgi:hypothetical protein
MTAPRTPLALLAVLLLAVPPAPADEVEQRRDGAVLRLQADKVEDGKVESRLSSVMRLTLTVEGQAPLQVGSGDEEELVKEQVQALRQAGPWFRCEAEGKPERSPTADGRERWQMVVLLNPLPPKEGTLKLQPAAIEFTEGPEKVRRRVTWEPIPVRVTTNVASADLKELRDITPPEDIPVKPSWLRWLPWVGLAVALAGLVAGGWELRRRLAGTAAPLAPHEWAARELRRIEAMELPRQGEVERYHTLLSDVVRGYLEQRFRLPASHQTTVEFLETMRRSPQLSAGQQRLLRDFLERCDMAKFARAAPPPEECRAVADMARAFVQETTPSEKAP